MGNLFNYLCVALYLSNPQRWNRYSYSLNSPLLYTDPNGEDVVIYYRGADSSGSSFGDFGHILIYVRNDETGEAAYFDYYPGDNSATVIGNVDQSRIDKHASFTIETTAEQEQAILNAVKDFQNSPSDFGFSLRDPKVCSTTCSTFLEKGGLGLGKQLTPYDLWEAAFAKYAPDQLIRKEVRVDRDTKLYLIEAPYQPGKEFGRDPRGQARKQDANAANANVKTTYQGGKVIRREDYSPKR